MKRILVLFFVIFSFSVTAQNDRYSFDYKDKNLTDVLTKLEVLYGVNFSYNATNFENLRLTLNLENALLPELLAKLGDVLNLVFDKINDRNYIIKRSKILTVSGFIKDVQENPVNGATVLNLSNNEGIVSDARGYFILENVKESDTLSIRFLGFKTVERIAKVLRHKECDTYVLSPENFELNEVVVQEYLASGILKMRDGGIRITPNSLEILSGLSEPDVLQNIQLLPGIESPSETASGLFIRGGTPDQNLILWDGIKMYNSDHFFGMLSAFNPYIVKEVNVYRSGTKVEYGDRVSGVVDIKTDNSIPNKTNGGLGFNLTHFDGFLKVPISEKLGVQISARRSLTDIFDTPTFGKLSDKVFQNTSISQNKDVFEPEFTDSKEDFYFTDVTLKAIANVSKKDKIFISSLFTKNKLDYSFADIEFNDTSSDKLDVKNMGVNTSWKREWNTNFSSKAQIYYSKYDFSYSGSVEFGNQNLKVSKKNNIKEVGLSFHTDLAINKQLTLTNGYQFFNNQVSYSLEDNYVVENDDVNNTTHSIYNQLNYQHETWYIDAGLRTSYYSELSSLRLEPRLYVENKLNDNFRIKASAEIKNQAISQIIEFATQDFGLENQIWALANKDDIPLLKSTQFSAGFLWQKKGWKLDLETYHKIINGLTSLTRGFELTNNNFAEGKSTTTGVDILLKKKFGDYSTWLGYTYSTTDFTFEELNNGKAFRGNNDVAHSLSWSQFYKWNNLQFSLGWKYRSGIPYTAAIGTTGSGNDVEINYGITNAETLPDYHRMDFSMLYDFKLSKKKNLVTAKLGISMLNIYGRKNVLSRNYALYGDVDNQDNDTIELSEISRLSLGTTPNLVFRMRF